MKVHRPTHRARTRPPSSPLRLPPILDDPDGIEPYLSDAAHFPGGHAPRVALPRQEGELAALLREAPKVLVIGAQSSVTGGATPMGEWVISTARMDAIRFLGGNRVRVQAGVPLLTLQRDLARRKLFYPPSTTFPGAFLGGTVATNAAGSATFKYGSTRDWVRGIRVMLADGEVLELRRGEIRAHPEGYFEIQNTKGSRIPIHLPTYRMPSSRKRSAGYHVERGMDLIDLFVGSEGTLGILTEVELEVLPRAFQLLTGLLGCRSPGTALQVAAELRRETLGKWESGDPRGLEVRSIEMIDRPSLDLLRSAGEDRESGLRLDPGWNCILFLEVELPEATDAARAREEIASSAVPGTRSSPLRRLCRLLERFDLLGDFQVALPGEEARAERIRSLREAVPVAVNRRIRRTRETAGPGIRKVAGDMVVPFESVGRLLEVCRRGFTRRNLEFAIWGHLSDGNLHPNVLPKSAEEVLRGEEAILEFGARAARMGGCPLSEHGVGRNPVKQRLLRQLYGDRGIEEMRRVKEALDPGYKLSPGVIFPARVISPAA